MKKLITLTAAVMMAVNMNAEEVVVKENVTDGMVLLISEIEGAGGADADIVTFYVSNNSGADRNGWGIGGFGPASGWDTPVEFKGKEGEAWTYEYAVSEIKEAAGGEEGIRCRLYNGCVVDKITVQPSITYDEARELRFDDGGFIVGSEFEGLSDDAKIVFTYHVEGAVDAHMNWGVGRISSNDDNGSGPSVVVANLMITALGEQTCTCKFSKVKEALDVTPEGIVFVLWNVDNDACTTSRVKVEAFNVSGSTTGMHLTTGNGRSDGVRCDLEGRKIGSGYRGIVIEGGRKYVSK